MKFTIDLETYFTIAQVGSSIHGDLLKPNDIDIAVGFKFPLLTFKKAFTFRFGKYNFILFHGQTVTQYVKDFDFNILRGYKSLFTKKLVLFTDARIALKYKSIIQLPRDNELFKIYAAKQDEKLNDRLEKYKRKLPRGWKLYDTDGKLIKPKPRTVGNKIVKKRKK